MPLLPKPLPGFVLFCFSVSQDFCVLKRDLCCLQITCDQVIFIWTSRNFACPYVTVFFCGTEGGKRHAQRQLIEREKKLSILFIWHLKWFHGFLNGVWMEELVNPAWFMCRSSDLGSPFWQGNYYQVRQHSVIAYSFFSVSVWQRTYLWQDPAA